jgi:hypothetical protein
VSDQPNSRDPARAFLEQSVGDQVIVWTDAADIEYSRGEGFTAVSGLSAYVGRVLEVYAWGLVVGGFSFRWATRWDLIEWAGPRGAFP